ncbi:MAG: ABC transporter ATP-binding protein/permease [Lachnospiraceae bacterium]|nr:ABC transporter ATP-binding protein/permease [Lachnospiraceae bacterium]
MIWNENKEKRTLREEWLLIWRGVKIWNEITPHFWLYQVPCTIAETFSPYFALYMSAQLVNELAGDCDYKRLLQLAGITVFGGLLVSLVIKLLQSKRELCEDMKWNKHEAFLADVQNDFQYEHLEDPDVKLRHSEIHAGTNATGAGLFRVTWYIPALLKNILGIVFSVSLTVSMFTMTAHGEYAGVLGFINSPASAVVILALIMINAICSIKISAVSTLGQQKALGKLAKANTRLFAFSRLWGADMVVFNLSSIVLEEGRKNLLRPEWVAELEKVTIKYNFQSILLNAVINLCVFLFIAAKAFIGVFGIGSFILYQGTTKRFIEAVAGVAADIGRLRQNNSYLVSLYEYLDLPNDMYKGTLAVEKRDDIDYDIEFRDVSFRYPRTDAWALHHVSMKFSIGDKLAIVGENGSGKTTFIKLLCRLYDPTEGKILLNGIDITKYRYDEYMALFSVVFQDYTLIGFPLGENVAISDTYDETRVRDCLIRAGLGDKLESLDNDPDVKEKDALKRGLWRNYDSEGIELSGGENQKVALARALYKDAPFVVLDEPTAALDPIAEAAVYENFNVLVENKTSVFISHRLSSCRFCDSIAVFDHGQLIQQGSHDVLVADAGGKYSQLWHAQAQYYEK